MSAWSLGAAALLATACAYPTLPLGSPTDTRCVRGLAAQAAAGFTPPMAPLLARRIAERAGRAGAAAARPPRRGAGPVVDVHRLGHTDGTFLEMQTVAWSPDERFVAAGHGPHVIVYDAELGREDAWWTDQRFGLRISPLPSARNEPVRLLRFSSDGRWLVVAGDRTTTRAWDLRTGRPLPAFVPGGGAGLGPFVQAISPDGRWVTHRAGTALQLYAVTSGTLHRSLEGHVADSEYAEPIDAAAFDPTARWIATGDDVGTLRLWRVADGRLLRTIEASRGRMVAIAFSPNGKLVATSCRDEAAVRVRDVHSGRTLAALATPTTDIYHVQWSDDGRRVLAADFTESIVVWDLATCTPVDMQDRPDGFATEVRLSHDGSTVAAGFSWGLGLALWDAATGRLLHRLSAPEQRGIGGGSVDAVAFSADDRVLAAGTRSHTLLWTLPDLQPLALLGQLTRRDGAYVLDARGSGAGGWPSATGAFDAYGADVDDALVCRQQHRVAPLRHCAGARAVPGLLAKLLAP